MKTHEKDDPQGMELEMLGDLNISLSCEELASGSAEERTTFGLFVMTANDRLLTGGEDASQKELRHGPHVAGYPIAEWFVWNWWRLRWEVGRPLMKILNVVGTSRTGCRPLAKVMYGPTSQFHQTGCNLS